MKKNGVLTYYLYCFQVQFILFSSYEYCVFVFYFPLIKVIEGKNKNCVIKRLGRIKWVPTISVVLKRSRSNAPNRVFSCHAGTTGNAHEFVHPCIPSYEKLASRLRSTAFSCLWSGILISFKNIQLFGVDLKVNV